VPDEGSFLKLRYWRLGEGIGLFAGVDVMSLRETYCKRRETGGWKVQERKIWKRQEGIKEVEYI
jgi:hypothetical protein